jgi:hypothetical protein
MDHKAVILVTPHIGEFSNGHFFLKNVKIDHCQELNIPHMLEFEQSTKSFTETMSVIKEKMEKIQEILNE